MAARVAPTQLCTGGRPLVLTAATPSTLQAKDLQRCKSPHEPCHRNPAKRCGDGLVPTDRARNPPSVMKPFRPVLNPRGGRGHSGIWNLRFGIFFGIWSLGFGISLKFQV